MKLLVISFLILVSSNLLANSRCTCEDWDHNGNFGLVRWDEHRRSTILAPNVGTYDHCLSLAQRSRSCSSISPFFCTCEDWNRDGRYGIVLNNRSGEKFLIQNNIGSSAVCADAAAVNPSCGYSNSARGQRLGDCSCVDRGGYFDLVSRKNRITTVITSLEEFDECVTRMHQIPICQN